MTTANILKKCGRCGGTAVDDNGRDADGNQTSVTCASCNAGYVVGSVVDTTEIMAELSYIHGKVTAIWNQVKPGPKPVEVVEEELPIP